MIVVSYKELIKIMKDHGVELSDLSEEQKEKALRLILEAITK